MSNPKVQLYQKILNVYESIDYLQKDDEVKFNNTNYKAISEEKVTTTVREQLIKNKLIVLPIEQEHKKEGNLSTVDVKYKIIDAETGEYEIIVSSGTGADTQDKGVGKAMTYAYKYLFLRTFAIPTGEDPDKVSSAELDEKQRKAEEKAAKAKEEDDALLPQLTAKWETLAGSLDGFEEWHEKKVADGVTNKQMNALLAKKLLEAKKESA